MSGAGILKAEPHELSPQGLAALLDHHNRQLRNINHEIRNAQAAGGGDHLLLAGLERKGNYHGRELLRLRGHPHP